MSGYAFEDTWQNSLTIFFVFLASEFIAACWVEDAED